MTGAIVKFHNDFNVQPLRGFRSGEMDMLMAILSRVRDHGESEVTFTFEQLRTLCNYKDQHKDRLVRNIRSTNKKLLNVSGYCQLNDHEFVDYALFSLFKVNTDDQTLKVKIAHDVAYLVNDLSGNWTRFDLKEYINLTSRYAKSLYCQLKQWKYKGDKVFSIEDFRRLLDIPKAYKCVDIDRKVLKPAITELQSCFDKLRLEKQYKKIRRGRPRVSGYKFSWTPEKMPKHQSSSKDKQVDRKRIYLPCPHCGDKAVLELTARSGRHFWKCESCQDTFGSIAEVKGYAEEPNRAANSEISSDKQDEDTKSTMPSETSEDNIFKSEERVQYEQVQNDTKIWKNKVQQRKSERPVMENKSNVDDIRASEISLYCDEYSKRLQDFIEHHETEKGQCVVESSVLGKLFKLSGDNLSKAVTKQVLTCAIEALKPEYKKIEMKEVNYISQGSYMTLYNIEFQRKE